MYLLLCYPFINHVIEFIFSMESSLKWYWITKFKYFSFQINFYFQNMFVYITRKNLSLNFNLVIWMKS
jgi:hypothetical protein